MGRGFGAMTILEMIGIASLVLNAGGILVALTWGVSKIKDAIREEIEDHRREVDRKIDELRQQTGETIAAIRTKINETELWNRDTFMRRDSFYKVMEEHSANMRGAFDKIDARLERMEGKIDSRH
jgi:uncharacterized protein YukE